MALMLAPPEPRAASAKAVVDPTRIEASISDSLLPSTGRGFLIPFLLAALRPDARKWLGPERMAAFARVLKMKEQTVAQLLDAAPGLPEALRETGTWTGRRIPMLTRGDRIEWIELHWRPDTLSHGTGPRPARPHNGSFALRMRLPAAGRIELRGRLEEHRLDMVAEVETDLRKPAIADMEDCFALAMARLGLAGTLTVRSGRRQFRT